MSQKEDALLSAVTIAAATEAFLKCVSDPLKSLRDTLDVAQNAPPDGASDGSLTPKEWSVLREYEEHLSAFIAAFGPRK